MSFYSDGKGKKMDRPDCQIWYHGSPEPLTILASGSSITRNLELAAAFSHKPELLSVDDDGRIKHNGMHEGFIYRVDEEVHKEDISAHPACNPGDPWEWVTSRDLKLKLINPGSLL